MSQIDTETSAALHHLAESWLKRPLTAAEEQELEAFQRASLSEHADAAGSIPSTDRAEYARLQAAQVLNEGRESADSTIRDILQKIHGTTAQALRAQEREEQAILRVVEAAKSLADLRPAVLNTMPSDAPASSQLVLSQIADRLANLVKTEVDQCFKQSFGRLQQQLEVAVGELSNAAKQQAQPSLPPSAAPAPAPAPAGAAIESSTEHLQGGSSSSSV